MGTKRIGVALAAFAAGALAVAGCGDESSVVGTGTGANTLTIYSSLPLQGPWREEALSIVNGEKLALEQAGGVVGKFIVKYVSLDDSSSKHAGWDPGVAITNARQAVQDKSTIAYLGDFDSGASAISLPLLNSASILQISPSNSASGLTSEVGADKGEPEKYYPSGKRTFGRLIPSDGVQAAAQVQLQKQSGCKRTFLIDDGRIDGEAIVRRIGLAAGAGGLAVTGGKEAEPGADGYESLVGDVRDSGADCVFFGSNEPATAALLFKQLHDAMPGARLFASAGLATTEFAGALDASAARVTHITSPALAPRRYPASGRRFFRAYAARYGEPPRAYAINGYEAMRAALASIRAAGALGNDRRAVTQAFFRIRGRRSPLGTYSVEPDGDTTLDVYAVYKVVDGALVFDRDFKAA